MKQAEDFTKKAFSGLVNSRGSTLLIALSLLALLTGVAIMSVDRSNTDMDMSFNQLHEEQAFYTAEAGLARAVQVLNDDKTWRAGFVNQPLNNGSYSVAVIDKTINAALGDTIVMQSTGNVSGASSNLEVWLVRGKTYGFKHAAFGDDTLFAQNDACTDSYDSDSGSYAATQDNLGGDVGSNGNIIFKDNASIGGDASTAKAGKLKVTSPAKVWGDTTSKADPQPMDIVNDTDFTDAKNYNDNATGMSGTFKFSPGPKDLVVDVNKKVILSSGTYYFTSLNLMNQAQVELAPNAEVNIYVTGDIMLQNFAKMNAGGHPYKMNVFSSGKLIDFKNDTEFRGALFAPNAYFIHQNNAAIYGAVMAKSIELKNDACIHFDRAMLRHGAGSDEYEKVAWRLLE